jgi:hypothetical protein
VSAVRTAARASNPCLRVVVPPAQSWICSNFLDKMLCVIGTVGVCVYQLVAAVKKCVAVVLSGLLAADEVKLP